MIAGLGALLVLIGGVSWATGRYYVWLGKPDERAGEMNRLYRAWGLSGQAGIWIGKAMIIVGVVVVGVGALIDAA